MDNQVAVKAVIQNTEGKFLIMREGERWQAVGGRLEKGEKLEDGLRRETQEETGITDLEVGKVIHVDEWFAKPEGELKHIVALFFLCKTTSSDVTLSDEHQGFAWVSANDLERYGDSMEKEIKQAIILASV
ncbi:MAG TPA: NUDIX domain-containing protein [Candidatus Saccharimonadales bacterium]|nr:NUDIX domain-containing protein [Candidatus Saccharimonadales bacterium]